MSQRSPWFCTSYRKWGHQTRWSSTSEGRKFWFAYTIWMNINVIKTPSVLIVLLKAGLFLKQKIMIAISHTLRLVWYCCRMKEKNFVLWETRRHSSSCYWLVSTWLCQRALYLIPRSKRHAGLKGQLSDILPPCAEFWEDKEALSDSFQPPLCYHYQMLAALFY